MEKPVVILGGGIVASLLAYRLKLAIPGLKWILYQESSNLGNHELSSFRQSDCMTSMKWLKPLIARSWDKHQIKFPKFQKWFFHPYHLIDSQHFHQQIYESLGPSVIRLNNSIDKELALKEASFVIDARNQCHYKRKGFRKYLILEIELIQDHNLIAPVIFDGGKEEKDHLRSLSYFPLGHRTLLVKDFWYSKNNQINLHQMRNTLTSSLAFFGWKISKVLREDSGIEVVPLSEPIFVQENRVINLAGLFHDTTGCSIPAATKLIEKMVQTSFRYGEIKEIVATFRKDQEKNKKFFRFLNHLIIEKKQHVFETIYQQPCSIIERFSRGELNFLDRSRILVGKSRLQFFRLLNLILPYTIMEPLQLPKQKVDLKS